MTPHSIACSPRSITFSAPSDLLDADAIKKAIATSAAAAGVTYSGADLDGDDVGTDDIARPTPGGHTGVPQYPIAVASSNAGSYVNGSTIVFSGTYGGAAATSTATVVGTDGNATFKGDKPLDTVSSIHVAAQANTSGEWTFGFDDIGARRKNGMFEPYRMIRNDTTPGVISLVYLGGFADLLPVTMYENVFPTWQQLVRSTTTITGKFTLFE
jgi:hypothetical protein